MIADTDVLIWASRGNARAARVLNANRGFRISVVTYAEILQGTRSNKDGLGATVEITAAGKARSWLVRAGGSYLSQSQISPLFGLGSATRVGRLVVRWPSGALQKVPVPGVDQKIQVVEPSG